MPYPTSSSFLVTNSGGTTIGTVNPRTTLTVNASVGANILQVNDSKSDLIFKVDTYGKFTFGENYTPDEAASAFASRLQVDITKLLDEKTKEYVAELKHKINELETLALSLAEQKGKQRV